MQENDVIAQTVLVLIFLTVFSINVYCVQINNDNHNLYG